MQSICKVRRVAALWKGKGLRAQHRNVASWRWSLLSAGCCYDTSSAQGLLPGPAGAAEAY